MEPVGKEAVVTVEPQYEAFRPIQYLGSKLKLVEDISAIVEENKVSDTICDLFAGSGVVSHFLSRYNKVLSVDIQHYSTILCTALTNGRLYTESEIDDILNEVEQHAIYAELQCLYAPLIKYEESLLDSGLQTDSQRLLFANFLESCSVYTFFNNKRFIGGKSQYKEVRNLLTEVEMNFKSASEVAKRSSYCSYYFGGVYFSFRQSIYIDVLLREIICLHNERPKEYATLMAALLSTLSEIVTTVGKQFAQPMKLKAKNNKPKKFLSTRAIRDRQYDVADVFRKWVLAYASQSNENPQCAAFPMDYREFLETYQHKIGCFYADPPYTIDHYSRFYHVLETICLYDYPRLEEMNKKELGKVVMKGLYRSHRHQSPFSIPSQVESAFVGLFERTSQHNCPLLLSYSPFEEGSEDRPRLITLERLEELARKYFDSVEFIAVKQHKHRKLNKTALNTESNANGEIFILCK